MLCTMNATYPSLLLGLLDWGAVWRTPCPPQRKNGIASQNFGTNTYGDRILAKPISRLSAARAWQPIKLKQMKTMLALNYSATSALKRKVQLLIGVLPTACMFFPFVPIMKVANWLDSPAGTAYNPATNGSSVLFLWVLVAIAVMIAAMLVGHAIGWLLNMAVAALVLRWPWSRVRSVFLESQLPVEWYRAGLSSQSDADAVASQRWAEERQQGFARFVLKRGLLAWGVPMFILMYVGPTFLKDEPVTPTRLLTSIAIWIVAGCVFGASMWWVHQAHERDRAKRSARENENG